VEVLNRCNNTLATCLCSFTHKCSIALTISLKIKAMDILRKATNESFGVTEEYTIEVQRCACMV
jgi:hypothetical protein